MQTNYACELRDLLRDTPELRFEVGRRVLENDPSRLDLRYVIEFVDSLRVDAWAVLKARAPTQFELTYIALKVRALRDEAWELLVQTENFETELPAIADCCPELRDSCWEIMLNQEMTIWELGWVTLPSAPQLIDKIWQKMQSLGTLNEVCEVAVRHPVLLCRVIEIATRDTNWDPSTFLRIFHLTHSDRDLFPKHNEISTATRDLASELRKHRPNMSFELLKVTADSDDKLLVLLYSDHERQLVWEAIKHDLGKWHLEQVMINFPSLRYEAWDQFKLRYDTSDFCGDDDFVPFGYEFGNFNETIWQFLIETSPGGLFGPRYWPRECLAFIRRDWDQIQDSISFSSLRSIWRDLGCEDQAFNSIVIKKLAIKSPSFPEFIGVFANLECDQPNDFSACSKSPCQVLGDLERTHGSLSFRELVLLHDVSLHDRPQIEDRLLDFDCSLDDLLPLLGLDLSVTLRKCVVARVLEHANSVPSWALCNIATKDEITVQTVALEALRSRLPSESTESLVQIASKCESLALDAFKSACENGCDEGALLRFIYHIPSVREQAVAMLLSSKHISNCTLVLLLKHFPDLNGYVAGKLDFGSPDRWWRGVGELVYVDVDASDSSDMVEWEFEVGGTRLHTLSCTGERIVLGFSTHKYFDENWWYFGDASQYHPDAKPTKPLDHCYPSEANELDFANRLEREINRSYLNPEIRSVQLVKFVSEAQVEIQVEFRNGVIHRGWLTWRNSD